MRDLKGESGDILQLDDLLRINQNILPFVLKIIMKWIC